MRLVLVFLVYFTPATGWKRDQGVVQVNGSDQRLLRALPDTDRDGGIRGVLMHGQFDEGGLKGACRVLRLHLDDQEGQ